MGALSRRGLLAWAFGLLAVRSAPAGVLTDKWVCTHPDCDPYIYDPARGDGENIADPEHPIPPGTRFEDLSETWLCPNCGTGKAEFIRYYDPWG